ncbi:MAG: hypothetical protein K2X67_08020 [Burkholderiales bacterium]|nr:hypothetical protein [Burkholderiales bacterium]
MILPGTRRALAFAAFISLSLSAWADEATSPLDGCIAKAQAAREGAVTGWQELTDKPEDGYYVRIVGKDGSVGLTQCKPGDSAPLTFDKKTGLVRYEMYQRAKVAEPAARAVAPVVFVPPTRLTRMELSISMRGVPYYTYTLALPENRKATVEVDAVSGKPIKATVEYPK